ncbi:hypothetical protein Ahy_B05g074650 [Arachis hypogaea]|uniref:Uncharacterized protein n=1 Tax=Arachis hypogaea TaxID=3818 RepID=A0A444YZG0_ARAHY|nr:hypothetical protein Ahy_B05g074650 [Arachis hypogaea]
MKPALEDAVRVLARVTFLTVSLAEIGTRRPGVVKLPWITTASLLARMSVRTLRPVVRPPARASPHFELVHAELVTRVRVNRRVSLSLPVGITTVAGSIIRRQVSLQGGQSFL